jgi:hypothetical protein
MTPEHEFELLKTAVSVVPATLLSWWALTNQRRQTQPRLEVLLSPIFNPTLDGKSVLSDDWPGVVVRNQSTFPLRVANVGFYIGKKFFTFDTPSDGQFKPREEWPAEVAPRTRLALYPSFFAQSTFGRILLPELKGKKPWEVLRAYAITECNHTFFSRRLPRKSLKILREAQPPAKSGTAAPHSK